MIVGIGVDVCSLERFAQMVERRPGIVSRLFTPAESQRPLPSLAARFAAKEALAKALGSPGGLRWQDAEVVGDEHGAPRFEVSGTVGELMASRGGERVHVSLSHDADVATAFVVVEGR